MLIKLARLDEQQHVVYNCISFISQTLFIVKLRALQKAFLDMEKGLIEHEH